MKKTISFPQTSILRYLVVSFLLLVVLSACSEASNASTASTLPPAVSHTSHVAPVLHKLASVQKGPVTIFTLPDHSAIKNLVSTQSTLWFGEHDSSKIGKINAQGQLDEYALPTADARPGWVTPGLNDMLWFSEEGANQVAKISPQGDITEYAIPTKNAQPGQMLLWGNMLWFAENGAHKLGRVNQDGQQIVEFALSSAPQQIAVSGADKNNALLWFTEPSAHRIGHITFDGQVSEFPWPDTVTDLASIIGDNDGNLWFTTGQSKNKQLGYVAPNGLFTLFSTGKQNTVDQLMQNGDAIDFIELHSNTIWTINKEGKIQARFATPADLSLPIPLTLDASNGSYWCVKTEDQQSQLWNFNISPYGP